MGIRASAKLIEDAALELARKGRGLMGRRARHVEKLVDRFVDHAMSMPGGDLPPEVRTALQASIGHTVDALEEHVGRSGPSSRRRAVHDSAVVQRIYALRDAEQHLMQTHQRLL
jgi:hypothetical protein